MSSPFARGADAASLITTDLVRRLVAGQFPEYAELPVRPVQHDGWDNRTFRLGEGLTVRLPSAQGYVPQIAKEHRWLPYLAPQLPLPIPTPVGLGEPADGYPFPWSIYRWLDGTTAQHAPIDDPMRFAADLATFLSALQRIDAIGGPGFGLHSAFRGGPLATYEAEAVLAIDRLRDELDVPAVAEVWAAAMATQWDRPPVWFHGDVSPGNLLVRDGRLSAVIDFGTAGVGDPACETVIAWTWFTGATRAAFRAGLDLDADTWARGRGWALWKALIVLAGSRETEPETADVQRRVIAEVLADHVVSR